MSQNLEHSPIFVYRKATAAVFVRACVDTRPCIGRNVKHNFWGPVYCPFPQRTWHNNGQCRHLFAEKLQFSAIFEDIIAILWHTLHAQCTVCVHHVSDQRIMHPLVCKSGKQRRYSNTSCHSKCTDSVHRHLTERCTLDLQCALSVHQHGEVDGVV